MLISEPRFHLPRHSAISPADYEAFPWDSVVNSYTKCTLTDPNDKFIAISAPAEEYSNRYGDKLGHILLGTGGISILHHLYVLWRGRCLWTEGDLRLQHGEHRAGHGPRWTVRIFLQTRAMASEITSKLSTPTQAPWSKTTFWGG